MKRFSFSVFIFLASVTWVSAQEGGSAGGSGGSPPSPSVQAPAKPRPWWVGGTIGLGLAKLFTLGGDPTGGLLPVFHLGNDKMVLGAFLTLFVGLAAGAIPAMDAMRLKIVDALRRV